MAEEMADMFLSPKEGILLKESLKEYKDGMTISLEDFEKELMI